MIDTENAFEEREYQHVLSYETSVVVSCHWIVYEFVCNHFYCLGSNRRIVFDPFNSYNSGLWQKQMVIQMEICSTALGVQITYP